MSVEPLRRAKLHGYEFYRSIGSPKFVVAPMVEQSMVAFRLLCRRYGAQLAYSPMVHSRIYLETRETSPETLEENIVSTPEDRPFFIQFCGNDPEVLLKAAKLVEHRCDAVDLNLGCPQAIAKRGRYGSFLLTETELLKRIVSTLATGLTIPVTCKIRCLPRLEDTLKLALALQDAGCSILTVHGRIKEQNKQLVGAADWDAIKAVKAALKIPVFANGGIGRLADVHRCMAYTGCDGVMTSEAILENPGLFANRWDPARGVYSSQTDLARQYLEYARIHPPGRLALQHHVFKLIFQWSKDDVVIRDRMIRRGNEVDDYLEVLDMVEARYPESVEASRRMGCNELALPDVPLAPSEGLRHGGSAHGGPWYMRHTRWSFLPESPTKPLSALQRLEAFKKQQLLAERERGLAAASSSSNTPSSPVPEAAEQVVEGAGKLFGEETDEF